MGKFLHHSCERVLFYFILLQMANRFYALERTHAEAYMLRALMPGSQLPLPSGELVV